MSLYATATYFLPKMVDLANSNPDSKPFLAVTSGGIIKQQFPGYFALGVAKTAQHYLAMNMNAGYANKGVHVAAVVINGFVSPESPTVSPKKIAEVFWGLYEQGAKGEKEAWVSSIRYSECIEPSLTNAIRSGGESWTRGLRSS
jgi:hypothetical protein